MFKLSSELRTKIRQDLITYTHADIGRLYGRIEFKKDELELFYECKNWYKHVTTYFRTSYSKNSVKVDIGQYEGIWPFSISSNMTMGFLLDFIRPSSWKDWFIQEE